MKPKKQPNGAMKMPKPRVMYADNGDLQSFFKGCSISLWTRKSSSGDGLPVLVLPLPTKRAALAKKKWEGLSYEEKVEAGAKALAIADLFTEFGWEKMFEREKEPYLKTARVLLALTGEPSP